MTIQFTVLSLLAASQESSYSTYRTYAIEALCNGGYANKRNASTLLQDSQTCYGLAKYYLYGSSDILRLLKKLPNEQLSQKKRLNYSTYWFIQAAKLGAQQTQDYFRRIIPNYDPEMVHNPSFFNQLKDILQKTLEKSANTTPQEEGIKVSHQSTPPSNDSTYVGILTNPMDSKTISEEITPEVPE